MNGDTPDPAPGSSPANSSQKHSTGGTTPRASSLSSQIADDFAKVRRLILKVGLRLLGYLAVFVTVCLAIAGGVYVLFEGIGDLMEPGGARTAALVATGLGGIVASLLAASYFWSLCFIHIDNVHTGQGTDGEFRAAYDKLLPVAGVLLVKIAFLVIGQVLIVAAGGIVRGTIGPFFVTTVSTGLGAGLVAAYIYIHFSDLAVIINDHRVADALSRASDRVGDVSSFVYVAAWGLPVWVWICLTAFGLPALGFDLFGYQLRKWISYSWLVLGAGCLVLTPILVVVNYVVYRALPRRLF